MEEVSSFWNMKLSWQIFFCAMISTFTTDLFNSAFDGFKYSGQFGLFKADKYILFQVSHMEPTKSSHKHIKVYSAFHIFHHQVQQGLAVNILAFLPSALLGVLGGILGSLFTFINLKIARGRKRLLANIQSVAKQNIIRLLEPIIIMVNT